MDADSLVIKETTSGYCVRPLYWAGIIKDNILVSGEKLFESTSKYDCEQYITRQKLKNLIEIYPELKIVTVINANSVCDCTSGNLYKNIAKVEKTATIKYEGRLFIKGEDTEETVLSYVSKFTDEEYIVNWKDCILVYLE